MRISWIFYIIILLLAGTIVTIVLLDPGSMAYMTVWGLALLGVVLMVVFYRNVIRPLRTIANGIDLLRAQDFSSRLAPVGKREADCIVDMFNGMMSSLKEERLRLREQNHFLDLLIDVSPMGIIILNPEKTDVIRSVNKAAAGFLGGDDTLSAEGKSLEACPSPLGRILAGLKDRDVSVVRLNDSMVYRCSRLRFMDRGVSHPFILVEKLTDEVMRAERKSYEKVIRMIAHEANNSLGGMISVVGAAADMTDEPDLAEALRACERRGRDLGAFITKFASAVKIPEPRKTQVDLREMLEDWRPLLESICSLSGATLTMHTGDRHIPVIVDSVLIEQVVTNIVKNGAESAGEGGEVDIVLNASPVMLTVADNGPGIAKEASDMLFTPFFTTKETGHGLGLLFVREVLNSHGCRFSLETEEDGLTRFRIRF